MPKLWRDSVEAHRAAVHSAVLGATGELVAEGGPEAVTMSAVAERAGVGRATLYKYFPDASSIVVAWHEGQIRTHLDFLRHVQARAKDPATALEAVIEACATSFSHGSGELAAVLHAGAHVAVAREELQEYLAEVIAEAAAAGHVRADVGPGDLAAFCLHALGAAVEPASRASKGVVTGLILDALRVG